jgi:ParB/RepB/Spo0J family partition protein
MTQTVTLEKTLLKRRLGIDTLPAHETLMLPLERLLVPDSALIERQAHRLVKSITQVGILQAPAVMLYTGRDIHDPEAHFEVIVGRRRVLAARLASLETIKCEAYEASTPQLSLLMTLIENEQRSSAWVKEVEALRKLIDEHVGMTLDDLAAFGFHRASLSERLKIAQLPAPLVRYILAGEINRETARKLIRLTSSQQEQIAELAERGEEITLDGVKRALRRQIDAGLVPVQVQLAQVWNVAPSAPTSARLAPIPDTAPQNSNSIAPGKENAMHSTSSALTQLVIDLRHFEQSSDYQTVPQAVRTLTAALLQQVQVYIRTRAQSTNQADEEI